MKESYYGINEKYLLRDPDRTHVLRIPIEKPPNTQELRMGVTENRRSSTVVIFKKKKKIPKFSLTTPINFFFFCLVFCL